MNESPHFDSVCFAGYDFASSSFNKQDPVTELNRFFMLGAAVAGALAVGLGAFGAHALEDLLAADRLAVYETGVRYLAIHSLVLFITGWIATQHPNKLFTVAGFLLIAGMILFSGSLVLLALLNIRILGAVAPIGGLAFISGWLLLGLGAWKSVR